MIHGRFPSAGWFLLCVVACAPNSDTIGVSESALSGGVFLHSVGGVLRADGTAPVATNAAFVDSSSIKLAGGNPWSQVGTWTAAPALSSGSLSHLDDVHLWLGLKNSDDIGTRFDIRAQVARNGTVIATGQVNCIVGVTRAPNLATPVAVSFAPFSRITFNGTTDVLSLTISTRIGTNGTGAACGGHSNATGLRTYFDATSRAAGFGVTFDSPPPAVSFAPAANYSTPLNASSLALQDVNHDGRQDIVVAHSAGVSVLLGNGDGTLQDEVIYDGGAMTHQGMTVGDLNRDGNFDAVVTGQGSSTPVAVLLGNSDGSFQSPVSYAAESTFVAGQAIGDLDGDGWPDVVVSNFGSSTVSVLRNNGDGTLAAPVGFATNVDPTAVAIQDLNGDGRLDVATDTYGGTISVLLGNGDGTLQLAANLWVGNPGGLAAGDINGDGAIDLVATNCCGAATVSVLLGNGNGTFQSAVTYPAGIGPGGVEIGDLNGDGYPDLVIADNNNDEYGLNVSILVNNGDGTFAGPTQYAAERSPGGIALGDLNADGKPDFAVAAGQTDHGVSVFLNTR